MPDEVVPDARGVSVRRLSHADLEDALALSSTAGWNQRADDWQMLVTLAPAGSFAAVSDGRIVGTAIGIDYGRFSWIAMMLVAPAHRGRGLGRRLLEAALDVLPVDTPVRLDATPLGRPLYQAFGFEDEAALTRWVAGVPDTRAPSVDETTAASGVRRLTRADLALLAEHDRRVFGASRPTVLAWALEGAPEYAQRIDAGAASGPWQYCLGRRGRVFDQIGPVVAASDDAARSLAREALRGARGRPVGMDVFDDQHGLEAWLEASGFHPQRPLFRMRLPRRSKPGSRTEELSRESARDEHMDVAYSRELAILGPDFA